MSERETLLLLLRHAIAATHDALAVAADAQTERSRAARQHDQEVAQLRAALAAEAQRADLAEALARKLEGDLQVARAATPVAKARARAAAEGWAAVSDVLRRPLVRTGAATLIVALLTGVAALVAAASGVDLSHLSQLLGDSRGDSPALPQP